MTNLAIDIHQLVLRRLADAPLAEVISLANAQQPAAVAPPAVSKLVPPDFVKISSAGNELPRDASDWVAVKDKSTGLIWSRFTVGADRHEWKEAKDVAAGVDLCGWNDWRLPTRAELLSLVDDTRFSPAINTDFFDCKSEWYWTSTPAASSPGDCAWYVGFDYGYAYWYNQDGSGFVRAVRPSQ